MLNKKGFTLIEMVISMAIAATIVSGLLAITIVQYKSNQKIISSLDRTNQKNITIAKIRNILSFATNVDFQTNRITITTRKSIYGNTSHEVTLQDGFLYLNNVKLMKAANLTGTKNGGLITITIDNLNINHFSF